MFDNRPSFVDRFKSIFPPVTRNIGIISLLLWLAQILLPRVGVDVTNLLGLHYWRAPEFHFWQPVTFMFLHDPHGFGHLFWNMFALFMFGLHIERAWGGKRFLIFYLLCGISAAITQEAAWAATVEPVIHHYSGIDTGAGVISPAVWMNNFFMAIGASGAVYGILLAFGMLFPNAPIFLFFIPIPIKAKYMVIFYGVLELLLGTFSGGDGIAHFAHLGGMIGGLILILIWRRRRTIDEAYY